MDKIRGMSLEKAAKKSGVSQPTIIRLTRALGFRGYKEFRYAIVEELAREQLFYGDAIFSRTSQMMVVDMIYMGLIVSDYDRFVKRLDKSSRTIRDKAYPSV